MTLRGVRCGVAEPRFTIRKPTTSPNQRILTAIDSAANSHPGSDGTGAKADQYRDGEDIEVIVLTPNIQAHYTGDMVLSLLIAVALSAPPAAPIPVFEPSDPTPQQGDEAVAVAYSRNGKLLAVSHAGSQSKSSDHRIVLYDTATWKPIRTHSELTNECRAIAFSANGDSLIALTFSDGKLFSWDTRTGKPGRSLAVAAGLCSQ